MNLTQEHEEELAERTAIMLYHGNIPEDEVDALSLDDLLTNNPEIINGGQIELDIFKKL